MSSTDWLKVWSLLQVVWTAVSPALKSHALTELKALEATEADKPLVLALIKLAEQALV